MYIVLVEDDHLQVERIREALTRHFRGVRLLEIGSELGFRERLDSIERDPPDVVVMDIMLKWTDPSPDMTPAPEDVAREGFYRAGFRCTGLLRQRNATKNVPVVLFSALDERDLGDELGRLPENVSFLHKEAEYDRLVEAIKRMAR